MASQDGSPSFLSGCIWGRDVRYRSGHVASARFRRPSPWGWVRIPPRRQLDASGPPAPACAAEPARAISMDLITNVADGLAQLATAVAHPLPELTDEAVIAILMQLPLSELPSCAAACSHWARCVRSDGLLWSAGFASRFDGTVSPADARQACRRCFSALSTLKLQPVVGAESGRGRVGLRPRAGAAVGSLGPYVVLSGGATTGFEVRAT